MKNKTIGITGASGFIGSALKHYGSRVKGYNVVSIDRNFTGSESKFDVIFHLSCVHRSSKEGEVLKLNSIIDDNFLVFLKGLKSKPDLYFLSSVQEDDLTEYGESKRNTHESLHKYSLENGLNYKKYIIKNTFGPYSLPYKFSFIATFCQNIILNAKSNIVDKEIDLYYIEDLVCNLLQFPRELSVQTYSSSVEYVYRKLVVLNEDITKIDSKLDLYLANTLTHFKRMS